MLIKHHIKPHNRVPGGRVSYVAVHEYSSNGVEGPALLERVVGTWPTEEQAARAGQEFAKFLQNIYAHAGIAALVSKGSSTK